VFWSKHDPPQNCTKFGVRRTGNNTSSGQFEFCHSDHWLQRNTSFQIRRRITKTGAGLVRTLWSSNPGSGKFFRAAPTLQRRSQSTYHSEKPKFIKIGQVAAEQHQFPNPAPGYQNRRRIGSYALEFEPRFWKFFRASPTLQRRSQTTYHSEKGKFIKIGRGVGEI